MLLNFCSLNASLWLDFVVVVVDHAVLFQTDFLCSLSSLNTKPYSFTLWPEKRVTSGFCREQRWSWVDLISAPLTLSVGTWLQPPVINLYGKHLVLCLIGTVRAQVTFSSLPPSWPQLSTGRVNCLTLSVWGECSFGRELQQASVGARLLITSVSYQGSSCSRISLAVNRQSFPRFPWRPGVLEQFLERTLERNWGTKH